MTTTANTTVDVVEGTFGTVDGTVVRLFTIKNGSMEVDVITYGGIISSIRVPDEHGLLSDVVLGYETVEDYQEKTGPYFGAFIGRVGNRISKGKFSLDGTTYTLAQNNGENHLHGGIKGFDKCVLDAEIVEGGVKMSYVSPDGEEGYPGEVHVTVTYTLSSDDTLHLSYHATTTAKTIINLTNHSYFNLDGAGTGTILDHHVTFFASKYTPVGVDLIPTGEITEVKGTPFDFLHEKTIRKDNEDVENGYDTNFVLDRIDEDENGLATAAIVRGPISGRKLVVKTSEPGCQLYVGGFLDGMEGKQGKNYKKFYGFCLETQHFPDSVNQPSFPSTILEPEQPFQSTTTYQFVRPSAKRKAD
eukprot:m.25135 g.25135  ORF g.25135 m.25135 type:complete len:359 (+) comp5730_c0_seq1:59-1135(+)